MRSMLDVDLCPPHSCIQTHEHVHMLILYIKYFVTALFHRYFVFNSHMAVEHIYKYTVTSPVYYPECLIH